MLKKGQEVRHSLAFALMRGLAAQLQLTHQLQEEREVTSPSSSTASSPSPHNTLAKPDETHGIRRCMPHAAG